LFLGESLVDGPSSHPQPTQIILFLENLWEFAGTDEAAYREEIRITYLHELGHYFGMDEDDLEARGLD
jgi:predicted Zn-dependent protease with MMP-like domain